MNEKVQVTQLGNSQSRAIMQEKQAPKRGDHSSHPNVLLSSCLCSPDKQLPYLSIRYDSASDLTPHNFKSYMLSHSTLFFFFHVGVSH